MEKGYYETSIDEIAARVGIAKGTVYLHFASKEDLVVALFQQDTQKFLQVVEETIASAQTARAKMEAILRFLYAGFFSKRIQLFHSIYQISELRKIFVEKKGCMGQVWEQLSTRISSILEEGKAAGEFDTSIPTPIMLSTFFNLLSPRSYERLMTDGSMSPDELVQHLGRIYFKGIVAV